MGYVGALQWNFAQLGWQHPIETTGGGHSTGIHMRDPHSDGANMPTLQERATASASNANGDEESMAAADPELSGKVPVPERGWSSATVHAAWNDASMVWSIVVGEGWKDKDTTWMSVTWSLAPLWIPTLSQQHTITTQQYMLHNLHNIHEDGEQQSPQSRWRIHCVISQTQWGKAWVWSGEIPGIIKPTVMGVVLRLLIFEFIYLLLFSWITPTFSDFYWSDQGLWYLISQMCTSHSSRLCCWPQSSLIDSSGLGQFAFCSQISWILWHTISPWAWHTAGWYWCTYHVCSCGRLHSTWVDLQNHWPGWSDCNFLCRWWSTSWLFCPWCAKWSWCVTFFVCMNWFVLECWQD